MAISILSNATTQDMEAEFESQVLKADGIILVDFYADWCGPCKALNEVLHDYSEKLDDKNPNNVKIVKIDVDSAPQIAERYQVQGIPNVGIFKDGERVQTLVGLQPLAAYQSAISEVVLNS
jgi:thioredoxin 1